MRRSAEARPTIFLTFAAGDVERARPLTPALRSAGGGIAFDYALPSEPFAAQRSDLIRASLEVRLRRCSATVCLFAAGTLEDDWVRWTLAAARRLRQPLFGAPLAVLGADDVAGRLAAMGVEIVPLRGETIARRLASSSLAPRVEPLTANDLAGALRMMRRPLR